MTKQQIAALGALAGLIVCAPVAAKSANGRTITAAEFEAKLGYRTGTIHLPGGMATIRLPQSFRYLGEEGSRRLLVGAWNNPPEAAEGVLGMLVPARVSPLTQQGWGIVITYDEDGYVNDSDAAGIDYNKLMKEMQESAQAGNEERRKHGMPTMTLVGWAEPPSYDAATHKMYWAKELAFADQTEHTLNYSIRILGRRGVLVLNAVSAMKQLPAIRKETHGLLSAVEFQEGSRYQDFLPGKDKAAAYGITGLIVGAAAAKVGLFKALWVGLLAFKKFLILGFMALVSAVKRLFGRKNAGSAPSNPAASADKAEPAGGAE